ncbi:MAG: hypothetical protein JSV16_11485 [Candidatus Hydrogenedentota bacterium]|nr:MAG: hypothetical protein JSV16_11485 [Candidatus Hydrogenedentota bacterium]
MKKRVFYCVLGLLAVVVIGCGKKGASQATPRETLDTLYDSVVDLDKSRYMSVLHGTDAELEAASVLMDYFIAISDFRRAVEKEYGSTGWEHFEGGGGAQLTVDLAERKEKLDSAKIEVTGEKASCTIPGERQVMHLCQKKGLWYIEAGTLVNTGGADTGKFTTMWKQMTELIKSKQKRVGQPGVTAESLDAEMGNELIRILMTAQFGIEPPSE